jgi:predicted O-methyltransferase YrrM
MTKTFVVTRNIGALTETGGDRGILLDNSNVEDPYTVEWQEKALKGLFAALENKELKKNLIEKNYNWAKNMSWENRVKIFLENYIEKPVSLVVNSKNDIQSYIKNIDKRFDYANMYNWTNDLPPTSNSYDRYIKILQYIKWKYTNKEINVLEIGTYAGTSIIKILETLPNSKGTVIDRWENYVEYDSTISHSISIEQTKKIKENNVEQIFYNNIKIANIKNINVLKGDSANILLNMIGDKNKKFDFIYIDGSHTLMDSYTDLLLSFNLLNQGGVIGIDDYVYNKGIVLDSPYIGVEHFMDKFKTKINVLDKDYRVFIEKI